METEVSTRDLSDEDILDQVNKLIADGIGQQCFGSLNKSAQEIMVNTISDALRSKKYNPALMKRVAEKSK